MIRKNGCFDFCHVFVLLVSQLYHTLLMKETIHIFIFRMIIRENEWIKDMKDPQPT